MTSTPCWHKGWQFYSFPSHRSSLCWIDGWEILLNVHSGSCILHVVYTGAAVVTWLLRAAFPHPRTGNDDHQDDRRIKSVNPDGHPHDRLYLRLGSYSRP